MAVDRRASKADDEPMLRVVLVLGIVLGAVGCVQSSSTETPRVSCPKVVVEFERTFPAIYDQAGRPNIECIRDPNHGSGGYSAETNGIQINGAFSPEARAWGVTDKRRYLMHAVAHEIGHAWANHDRLAQEGEVFKAVRGYSPADAADPVVIQEDYAETFAYALGWWPSEDECYAHVPYCWQLDAGKPTSDQIETLRSVGLLPEPR